MNEVYKELVGEKAFNTALDVLHKINAYHEGLGVSSEENLGD